MKITILTLFPEMYEGFVTTSIIKRAIQKEKVEIELVNIRDFSNNKHNTVDDTPYGGGAGMVMRADIVRDAINSVRKDNSRVLITAAKGKTFNQAKAYELSKEEHLIIVAGHYEGIDERVLNFVDETFSIGDFVLTGGELPSMVLADAVIRLLEGAITSESLDDESYTNNLLEYPQYTKPEEFDGLRVPDVLLSGHHANIKKWRLKESIRETVKHRPDLLKNKELTKEEEKLLEEVLIEENIEL